MRPPVVQNFSEVTFTRQIPRGRLLQQNLSRPVGCYFTVLHLLRALLLRNKHHFDWRSGASLPSLGELLAASRAFAVP